MSRTTAFNPSSPGRLPVEWQVADIKGEIVGHTYSVRPCPVVSGQSDRACLSGRVRLCPKNGQRADNKGGFVGHKGGKWLSGQSAKALCGPDRMGERGNPLKGGSSSLPGTRPDRFDVSDGGEGLQ